MGNVYRAERDDGKFEQRVAIKVVSGGLNTPAFVERFQQEYRILASLEHQNIARLLDSERPKTGYLISSWNTLRVAPSTVSAKAPASATERLRLILPVRDAVSLPQRLIVHAI
jgi:serine/threonine protein kinase